MAADPLSRAGTLRLAGRQVAYQVKLVLRSPTGAFFTFVIPVMVLIALNLVYGHHNIPTRRDIRFPRFYTPAMAAFAITNACYVSLLTGVTLSRQQGMLKRIRGTPLPPWVYLFGRAASAAALGALSAAAVLVIGTSMYPVTFPWDALPSLCLLTAVGIACFCSLGLAVSALVDSADAALPVAYGTLLPLCFVSDVFFPTDTSPAWLRALASALPLRPLAQSLEAPFMPTGTGLDWTRLAVLVGWTLAALAVVGRYFRWEQPAGDRRPGRHASPPPATVG